jgi:hypothetical protein
MSLTTTMPRSLTASLIAVTFLSGCADMPKRAHRVNAAVSLHIAAQSGTDLVAKGSLTGAPNGSITITFNRATSIGLFTVQSTDGTLSGTVHPISYSLVGFRDAGEITDGTRIFALASSSNLTIIGRLNRHLISNLRLTGTLYY